MDALTVLTLISLCISELLPLIHNTTANGILHFVLVSCKDIIEVIDKKEEDTHISIPPSSTQDGSKSIG